ncbi:MAG TPA: SGNH/GDSL hydrolase family protein [Granulicella sp.]|jgi:lysophospholipase L1-like esterase|nr:SGNH/GDSL hydrolase family protein [Granulicella sp.]
MHLGTTLAAAMLFAVSPLLSQTPATPANAPAPISAKPDAIAAMQAKLDDWAQLNRYRADNAALPAPAAGEQRVVFYGDSITDGWGRQPGTGTFFPDKPYANRGISGQTTPQMLVRFQQDVVHLHPALVVILAGTNDVAGNTGPSTPEMTEDNFAAMAAIARQNDIKVILASITPAYVYPWKPSVQPVATIREINQWLKDYCAREHFTYLDYYSAMVDDKGGMKPGLSFDGVHPTAQGYAIMGPLAEAAIAQALGR